MTKWMICPACRGEGTCVNPNIDGNGLSAEDFHDDPDLAEDYLSGVYDVACGACNGSGKILRTHMATLRQNASDRRLAAMEDGNYEAYQYASDYRFG